MCLPNLAPPNLTIRGADSFLCSPRGNQRLCVLYLASFLSQQPPCVRIDVTSPPNFCANLRGKRERDHGQQTAKIMMAFEEIGLHERPDCVLVVGDVNSTLACSVVFKKFQIPVAHVEAGLRYGDMRMPEEINRLVTDDISDWLFVTEPSGTPVSFSAKARPRTLCSLSAM